MGKLKDVSDITRYKRYLEGVCEFMALVKVEINEEKPNFNVNDYTLGQYQARLGRRIDFYSPRKIYNESTKKRK